MALLVTTPLNNHLLSLVWIAKLGKAISPREFTSSCFVQFLAGDPARIPHFTFIERIKGAG
jgi:hypothetical protein